ncbi:MAG: hypothetical protein H7070_16470 [Saprospiraceae bacterium]|nr:hypothetical protein [Pyrinomonadaceae bacterium]
MNKLRIRKLGIFSVAKIYGIMCLVLGFLISIPYGLFIIVFSLMGASVGGGGNEALALGGFGIVGGIAVIIIIPLMYAIMGFIGGIIGALIYNVLAGIVGGIEIEVENVP